MSFSKNVVNHYLQEKVQNPNLIKKRESIHFQKRPSPKKKLSLLQVRKKVKKKKLVMA